MNMEAFIANPSIKNSLDALSSWHDVTIVYRYLSIFTPLSREQRSQELQTRSRSPIFPLLVYMYWQTARPYRPVMKWFEAMDAAIKAEAGIFASPPEELLCEEIAAELIFASAPTFSYVAVGIDKSDPTIKAGWTVVVGHRVSVTPTATGCIPQYGMCDVAWRDRRNYHFACCWWHASRGSLIL